VRTTPAPLGEALYATLEGQGAFDAARSASEQVPLAQLWRRLVEWNDGFRTLKLIHGVRDHGLGEVVFEGTGV
ncbi:MAG: hypothetical protein QGG40_13845, partial [Myxococcota bacterium]|nr:hypothetical protein [Myxococcota bacterium]